MRKILKFTKWLIIGIFSLVILSVLYLRFSRFSDAMIYQTSGFDYEVFESDLNYEQLFFEVNTNEFTVPNAKTIIKNFVFAALF